MSYSKKPAITAGKEYVALLATELTPYHYYYTQKHIMYNIVIVNFFI